MNNDEQKHKHENNEVVSSHAQEQPRDTKSNSANTDQASNKLLRLLKTKKTELLNIEENDEEIMDLKLNLDEEPVLLTGVD